MCFNKHFLGYEDNSADLIDNFLAIEIQIFQDICPNSNEILEDQRITFENHFDYFCNILVNLNKTP
jgi:hypothetical protein